MMRFSKEYAKLRKDCFTTIRKNDPYYRVGATYTIMTPEQEFSARIVGKRMIQKADITPELAVSDGECMPDELVAMLERWYGEDCDDFVLLSLVREARA